MRETTKKKYYRVRIGTLWLLAGGIILLFLGVYFKEELYEKWLKSGGIEDVIYEGESRLKNQGACYLCGSSDHSLMDYCREYDTIGLISLNDWYVLELRLERYDENGNAMNEDSGTSSASGNMGEIIYSSESYFYGAMASIEITLPEGYELELEILEERLCQDCLDKVMESLEFRKWKYEKKEAVPLCLVDFKTLEIYSLQDWHRGCLIRDYWVEIETEGNKTVVDAYTIPQ